MPKGGCAVSEVPTIPRSTLRLGRAREFKINQVYESLKLAIVTGELPPEAPIDKAELCARFGASRLCARLAC